MCRCSISPPAGRALRDFAAGLSLDNYKMLGSDWLYLTSYLRSLAIAALSTAILLLIGYPIAYGIARMPRRLQPVLVMAVFLPFWTAFLIRIYAWINILQRDGLLNDALIALGIIHEPVVWLATDTAIFIGIVYSYLPFMVLPLYASLEKMDETLLEAAADLGAPRWKAFWLITVPLSAPGIVAGALLCFIPIAGEFVIPDLLGGSDALMIGQTLWTEFFQNQDWPVASAVAIALLVDPAGADPDLSAPADAGAGGALMRKASTFNVTVGRARPRLPLSADRDPGDLFVQRLAAGHRLGRLVDALVRRAAGTTSAMLDAAWTSLRIAALSATAATVLGTLAAVALVRAGRFRGRTDVLRHGLCAAGDARGHHRAVAAAAVRRARPRPRLLDGDDRAHHADAELRHRGGAVAAAELRPQPGGGGDGPRLPAAARPSSPSRCR